MRRSRLVWLILLSLCSGSLWAAFPGLRYLGEIGHLGTPSDPRTSVRFGNVQVVATHDGALFHGRDDDGKTGRQFCRSKEESRSQLFGRLTSITTPVQIC